MVRDVTGEKPRRQIPKLSQAKVGIWDCAPSMRKVVGFAKTYIFKGTMHWCCLETRLGAGDARGKNES